MPCTTCGQARNINMAAPRFDGPPVADTAGDGREYPLQAWVVCPGDAADEEGTWYVMGTNIGWQRAQSLAVARGCPFDASRVLLTAPPTLPDRWVA